MAAREPRPGRSDYRWFLALTTRWMDNDVYRHVNNVVYYSFFDTAINRFLIEQGMLDIARGSPIGLVVETTCSFHAPMAFPDDVHAGVRIGHIGNSSVRYEVGLFRNSEDDAAAHGHFVHVYVDRGTNRPVPIPDQWRQQLASLLV